MTTLTQAALLLHDAYGLLLVATDDSRQDGAMAREERKGCRTAAPLTREGRISVIKRAVQLYRDAGYGWTTGAVYLLDRPAVTVKLTSKTSHADAKAYAGELLRNLLRLCKVGGIDPVTGELVPRMTAAALLKKEAEAAEVAPLPALPVSLLCPHGAEVDVDACLDCGIEATPDEPTDANGAPLSVPMVHLNGSGKPNLMKPLEAADKGLSEAYSALRQAGPHMRDYYVLPNGEEAFKLAVKQHSARMERLKAVQDELVELLGAIDAQGPKRERFVTLTEVPVTAAGVRLKVGAEAVDPQGRTVTISEVHSPLEVTVRLGGSYAAQVRLPSSVLTPVP